MGREVFPSSFLEALESKGRGGELENVCVRSGGGFACLKGKGKRGETN